jgi:hypothetical protein
MKYQELRDYALQCSLEHHLCNVGDLLNEGKTLDEIMAMVEESDNTGVVIYEPYEHYESSSLLEAIEDARGVKVHEFMQVLTRVNGEEWATNYKQQEVES